MLIQLLDFRIDGFANLEVTNHYDSYCPFLLYLKQTIRTFIGADQFRMLINLFWALCWT